jgi:TRAP-type mannitol/chloroaromatic compound transport system permease small subunit
MTALNLSNPANRGFFLRLADVIAQFGLWFSGGLILAAALLVSYDVLARKLFNVSLGNRLGLGFFLCFAPAS